ncbi:hypothetical protein CXB51_031278 [Gossypium anomalum]|uniref:Reverse transcriptase Ty1/copia-type domain-containing protein n=1 Tax=Gossypium anomalum TaxID=47600 RepID=A0A8J6CLJ1_9ROSI|nr:hypothetical protein CXB51_031278 [Gossypium anomalum]
MSEGIILMGNNASCKIAGVGMIKVKMFEELLEHLGSTVTGDAAVASSSLSDDVVTRLWHMRLGHMSENDMIELSKIGLLDGQGISKLKFYKHCTFGKQKRRYAEADLVAYALNVAEDIYGNKEPSTYSEAVGYEDSKKWMFALQEEMESLYKNKTRDLVKLPKGKKVVRCKWVFKWKEGTPRVEEPKYKARLVAKGYSQIPEFETKDLRAANKILGMKILKDTKVSKLYLSQKVYIEKVLYRFNIHSAKPVSAPLVAHFRLSSALSPQSDDEIDYMSNIPYSSAVESLMYAMVCSHRDLSYVVNVVSRYMANLSKEQ